MGEMGEMGDLGDCAPVGDGVIELRIHFVPDYRIYFGRYGMEATLLLSGGDKSTQAEDIRRAESM
jgi:putative addiction module killer protein